MSYVGEKYFLDSKEYRLLDARQQKTISVEAYQVTGEGHELLEECRVEEVLAAADDRVFVLELSHEHLGEPLHQHRQRRLRI